jgi:large subunit ribosomal protein L10
LAISKQRKDELVRQYIAWMNQSEAMYITQYTGLKMKDIDVLRAKTRELGGEFHIVKNTLGKVAFKTAGMTVPENYLEGSTAIIFAFKDAPAVAKVLADYARTSEFVKVKGGLLDRKFINAADVKAFAELPPLPVIRAQLLGVLQAPASKLVRTLAEPARQIAAVLKSYADKDSADVPA